jgi:hypothetical protein
MAKTFESLFGSVTCLPGCFTLYRLRTPDTHKPLLISNQLITDYSENQVDTLHMKNLLHLGEDRYLTTLLFFETFSTFQDSVCPRCTCVHCGSGRFRLGRFYYPSVDVELTLRFTTWANPFSWSNSVVS